ncbi:MAG: beta/gamma crystallin domain-containing protein [Ktedonobacteraceae bacterium]
MRSKAFLPLLALALLLSVFTAGNMAHAATVPSHSNSAGQVYTIEYFDGSGHLTKTWKGSPTDAEKIKSQYRQDFLTKFAKQMMEATSTQRSTKGVMSPNLDRVDRCILPNDFFDFYNNGPLVCFANSGWQDVGIYSVYEVDSGNNNVGYYYDIGNANGSHTMGHNQTAFYSNPTIKVWHIYIQ